MFRIVIFPGATGEIFGGIQGGILVEIQKKFLEKSHRGIFERILGKIPVAVFFYKFLKKIIRKIHQNNYKRILGVIHGENY